MRLYSYIVTHDTGFAPNPFFGYCTLACCKPAIRRTAKIGDWIVGLTPKRDGNRIIYAMKVEEILTFDQYYRDSRFKLKIPDFSSEKVIHKCGDNIYKPLPGGGFKQLKSMHSNGETENQANKIKDLGGKYVLISKTFYYFGSEPIELPPLLEPLKVGRGYKCRFSPDVITTFINFISQYKPGVHAKPTGWKSDDDSWKKVVCGC